MSGPLAPFSGGNSIQQSTPVPAIQNFDVLKDNKLLQEDPRYTADIKNSQPDAPTTPIKDNGMSRGGQPQVTPRFQKDSIEFTKALDKEFFNQAQNDDITPSANSTASGEPDSQRLAKSSSFDQGVQITPMAKSTAFDQGVQITPMAVALGYGVHKVDDGAMYVFSVNGVVKVLEKNIFPTSYRV